MSSLKNIFLLLALFLQSTRSVISINESYLNQDKKYSDENVHTYTLNTFNVVHKCNKNFLGFSIDTNEIKKGLHNPTLRNSALIRLVSYLSPGYLRIGGIQADCLIFEDGMQNAALDWKLDSKTSFFMSEEQWIEICDFANITGLKLLFDLNVLLRKGYNWDYANAKSLLQFTAGRGLNIDWQLGNEPNSFPHNFNTTISPTQLAKDFSVLKLLLKTYPAFQQSLLVGPDITSPHPDDVAMPPERFLYKFNLSGGTNAVDAVGWHHYYLHSSATKDDFMDPDNFDSFLVAINTIKKSVKGSEKPIWITESGSASGGGVEGVSDKFVASFLMLDRLGLAAREGIDTVIRQSLYAGHYALIDRISLTPSPDWWITYIYKRLVDRTVLSILPTSKASATVRLYAQCSIDGTVVVFGMNLRNITQQLVIKVAGSTSPLSAHFYQLTSPHLLSRDIQLNGNPLRIPRVGPPRLPYLNVNFKKPLSIASYAIFFLQFHTLNSPSCV